MDDRQQSAETAYAQAVERETEFGALEAKARRRMRLRMLIPAVVFIVIGPTVTAAFARDTRIVGPMLTGGILGVGFVACVLFARRGRSSARQPLVAGLSGGERRRLHRVLLRGEPLASSDRELVSDYAEKLRTSRWVLLACTGVPLALTAPKITLLWALSPLLLAVTLAADVVLAYFVVLNFRLHAAARRALAK